MLSVTCMMFWCDLMGYLHISCWGRKSDISCLIRQKLFYIQFAERHYIMAQNTMKNVDMPFDWRFLSTIFLSAHALLCCHWIQKMVVKIVGFISSISRWGTPKLVFVELRHYGPNNTNANSNIFFFITYWTKKCPCNAWLLSVGRICVWNYT